MVTVAFLLSFWMRSTLLPALGVMSSHLYPLKLYLPLLPVALLVWGVLLLRFNLYHSQTNYASLLEETWDIIRVCVTGTLLLLALVIYLFRLDQKLLGQTIWISRLWILLFVGTTPFCMLAGRMILVRLTARWVRLHGYNYRTVIIAGTNETARKIAKTIEEHPYWGYRILDYMSERREGVLRAGTSTGHYRIWATIEEISSHCPKTTR